MEKIIEYILTNLPTLGFAFVGIAIVFFLFKNALETMKTVNEEMKTINEELRKEFDRLKGDIRELRSDLASEKEKARTLAGQTEFLLKRNEQSEKQIDALQTLVAGMRESHGETLAQLDKLGQTLGTISKELHSKSVHDGELLTNIQNKLTQHGIQLINLDKMLSRLAQNKVDMFVAPA
jgi:chromosome segregation ATPase